MNISISNHTLINFTYRDYRFIKGRQEGCISQHYLTILLGRGKVGVLGCGWSKYSMFAVH
jgi:hypothetical protein